MMLFDTAIKEETAFKNSCSMYLSTFVPEYFLNLAYSCMAVKAIFLYLNIKDNKKSYNERNKFRLRLASILSIIYLSILTVVLFLRCLNTCQRDKVQWTIE
jgi:L-asparagine transporter-like permease